MKLRWHLLIFAGLFAVQYAVFPANLRRTAPWVGDAAENLSIGQNLARGHGYRFDWDDPTFRQAFADQNVPIANGDGEYDRILARRGSYPTLARPPLMPLLLAGCVLVSRQLSDVFFGWRLLDMAVCAAAGSLLCGAAVAARRGRRGGVTAAVALLAVFYLDPIRWQNVPAWWNEGLAFDLTAVGCWLLADGRRALRTSGRYRIVAGVALGLLCLDRSVFVLLVPPLAVLLATADVEAWRPRLRSAFAIAAVAVAVQSPWWTRNVVVAGRFVPLGTQGGFNLPDEYGPVALETHGNWDGRGISHVWFPPGQPVPLPAGYTEARLARVSPGDRRWAALVVAFDCTSTASELAISDAGTRAAVDWVRHHPTKLPGLFVAKAWTLTAGHRGLLATAAAIVAMGYAWSPSDRRLLRRLAAWVALYWFAVASTHLLGSRFLVPGLPPIYLAVAVAVAAVVRPRMARA